MFLSLLTNHNDSNMVKSQNVRDCVVPVTSQICPTLRGEVDMGSLFSTEKKRWYISPLARKQLITSTSSTAQSGGGSFKNRKPIGEVGCCESGMAERSHWWSERWLISLTISLSFSDYLPTYLPTYLSLSLSLSIYLPACCGILCASRHNSVHFFISHLASWLRTRRFSEPTFRPSGAPNHWKNTVFRDFPTFSRICIFFLLTLSLLWSSVF